MRSDMGETAGASGKEQSPGASRPRTKPNGSSSSLVWTRKLPCALCSGVTLMCQITVVPCLLYTGLKGRIHVNHLTCLAGAQNISKSWLCGDWSLKKISANGQMWGIFYSNWGHMNQDNSCFVYKIRKNKREDFQNWWWWWWGKTDNFMCRCIRMFGNIYDSWKRQILMNLTIQFLETLYE